MRVAQFVLGFGIWFGRTDHCVTEECAIPICCRDTLAAVDELLMLR